MLCFLGLHLSNVWGVCYNHYNSRQHLAKELTVSLAGLLAMHLVALVLAACAIHVTQAASSSRTLLSRSDPLHHRAMALSSTRDGGVSSGLLKFRGGSSVKHIETAAELDQIISQTKDSLIVVDFSAEWCGPCRMIAPVFDELALATADAGAVFCKVDVDKTPELADRYEVQGMPTFVFIKDGAVVERFAGASAQKLREVVEALL